MAIVRWWDPLRDLSSIQEKMNQLFEDTLSRTRGREEGLGTGMWTPAVDIYETDKEIVLKVERMLNLAEYKRRQAAPGVKVTLKNFGRDRRYPIVNRFRDSGAPLPEADKRLLQGGAATKNEAFGV